MTITQFLARRLEAMIDAPDGAAEPGAASPPRVGISIAADLGGRPLGREIERNTRGRQGYHRRKARAAGVGRM